MLKEKEIKKVIKPYGFTMINTYEDYLNTNTVKCYLATKTSTDLTVMSTLNE